MIIFIPFFVDQGNEEKVIYIPFSSEYKNYYQAFKEVSYFPALLAIIVRIRPVKAGEYTIPANSSTAFILKKIWSGDQFRRSIYVPEGSSSRQIFELISNNEFLSGPNPNIPPEGTLIADTYYFIKGTKRVTLINKIKLHSKLVQDAIWLSRPKDYPLDKNQWIILSSILEKEGLDYKDKIRIAGVILNRMKKKMLLQIDATVLYIKSNGLYDKKITWADIKKDKDKYKSKYNTYLYPGLPIGAITNPGAESMKAALNPEKTKYLYYRLVNGNHIFSESFIQHKHTLSRNCV